MWSIYNWWIEGTPLLVWIRTELVVNCKLKAIDIETFDSKVYQIRRIVVTAAADLPVAICNHCIGRRIQ